MSLITQNGNPLRIAFPVVDCGPYCQNFRGPAILLHMEAIAPAHPLRDPNPHCKVVGQLQDGKQIQFTIPLNVWQDALKRPVMFHAVPMDSIGARAGILVDRFGNPLPTRNLRSTGRDETIPSPNL